MMRIKFQEEMRENINTARQNKDKTGRKLRIKVKNFGRGRRENSWTEEKREAEHLC